MCQGFLYKIGDGKKEILDRVVYYSIGCQYLMIDWVYIILDTFIF